MNKIVISKFSIVLIITLFSIIMSLFFASLSLSYEKHLKEDILNKISEKIETTISLNTSLTYVRESCNSNISEGVGEYICNKFEEGQINSLLDLKKEMAKAITHIYIEPKLDMTFRQFISNNNIGLISLIALFLYIVYILVVRGSLVEDGMVLLGIWFIVVILTFISLFYFINIITKTYNLDILSLVKKEFYAAFALASLITTLPIFGVIAVQRGLVKL